MPCLYRGSNADNYAEHADARDHAAVPIMPVAVWFTPAGDESLKEYTPTALCEHWYDCCVVTEDVGTLYANRPVDLRGCL